MPCSEGDLVAPCDEEASGRCMPFSGDDLVMLCGNDCLMLFTISPGHWLDSKGASPPQPHTSDGLSLWVSPVTLSAARASMPNSDGLSLWASPVTPSAASSPCSDIPSAGYG